MTESKVPMRRCIGCMRSRPQSEMIRFTLHGDEVVPDRGRKADGRGVYLCRSEECISRARKNRAFNRSFRRNLDKDAVDRMLDELLYDLKEVANGEKNQ
jgi:predicted RNA-binding protein YlxR (DUF448 family)